MSNNKQYTKLFEVDHKYGKVKLEKLLSLTRDNYRLDWSLFDETGECYESMISDTNDYLIACNDFLKLHERILNEDKPMIGQAL